MSDYPEDEQGRKKALAANLEFHKPTEDAFEERTKIKELMLEVESLTKTVDVKNARVIEFLHNSAWHLKQALNIIDEVEK